MFQVVRPPSASSAASASATSEGCETVTHEEILFTKRTLSASDSTSIISQSREDVEAVIDFTEEEVEVQSGEYYENVVFQTGKKPKVTENAKVETDEDYEEVLVKNVPHYENVNYSNQNEKKNEVRKLSLFVTKNNINH